MPRTAQAAMRHSTIDLTMNLYTDPKLLDVHGALDSLPELPLDNERIRTAATGTHGNNSVFGAQQFALEFAGKQCKPWQTVANRDKSEDSSGRTPSTPKGNTLAVTSMGINGNGPLTSGVNEPLNRGGEI